MDNKSGNNGGKTGWPPGLLQDDHSRLSKWFASKPEARYLVRKHIQESQLERKDMTTQASKALTLAHDWATQAYKKGLGQPCDIDGARGKFVEELRRLNQHELALIEWMKKTQWVQDSTQPDELGMHVADVLKQRITKMQEQQQELVTALESLLSEERHPYTTAEVVRARRSAHKLLRELRQSTQNLKGTQS